MDWKALVIYISRVNVKTTSTGLSKIVLGVYMLVKAWGLMGDEVGNLLAISAFSSIITGIQGILSTDLYIPESIKNANTGPSSN